MKIARYSYLILIPIIVAGLTAGIRFGVKQRSVGYHDSPAVEYPETIDLGEHEKGEVAVGRFWIRNGGKGQLLVDQFRTTCSCAGLEREVNGRFIRLQSIQLDRGDQVELVVRVAVNAQPGHRQGASVSFRTNDPARPEGLIGVIVSQVNGGVITVPTTVIFGTVPVRSKRKQVIDVYDAAVQQRSIERVTSRHPERFEARLLPVPVQRSEGQRPLGEMGGLLIGRFEVTARTEQAGPLDGEVEIYLAGEARPPDAIPVLGRVVECVEVSPSSLVLPRRSGPRLQYWGQVMVSSRDGKPLTVTVQSVPSGMLVEVSPVEGSQIRRLVRIEWKVQDRTGRESVSAARVRLRARVGEEEAPLEVKVLRVPEGRAK